MTKTTVALLLRVSSALAIIISVTRCSRQISPAAASLYHRDEYNCRACPHNTAGRPHSDSTTPHNIPPNLSYSFWTSKHLSSTYLTCNTEWWLMRLVVVGVRMGLMSILIYFIRRGGNCRLWGITWFCSMTRWGWLKLWIRGLGGWCRWGIWMNNLQVWGIMLGSILSSNALLNSGVLNTSTHSIKTSHTQQSSW